MRAVRVAFAGAAHSHAFSDARNLRARGAEILGVWDADDPGPLVQFAAEFGVPEHLSLASLLGQQPDLIVATVRTPRAVSVSRAITAAGVPSFFNKTIASSRAALDDWLAIDDPRRFTSSVLRFAPRLAEFADAVRPQRLRALDVRAQHDISGLLSGDRSWQDALNGAGGTLVNFGVHAWEMIEVLLPGERAEILSGTATREGLLTASEAIGTVRGRIGEVALIVTVSGVGASDVYAVRAVTDAGTSSIELPIDAAQLGYHGAADAMLRLARGADAAVTAPHTAVVYENVLAAAATARSSLR
ncbi:hypothetical protein [Microbacterium sp. A93]|uniref:hypothetical protein n=1 Tax=unclassified Microbacterium TaxID=2609290 RepID=UPI003F429BA4